MKIANTRVKLKCIRVFAGQLGGDCDVRLINCDGGAREDAVGRVRRRRWPIERQPISGRSVDCRTELQCPGYR